MSSNLLQWLIGTIIVIALTIWCALQLKPILVRAVTIVPMDQLFSLLAHTIR